MACGFSWGDVPGDVPESKCEGCQKKEKPRVSYHVEVNQELCDDCADEKQDSIRPVRRKVRWFCDKHPEKEAEIFCETHQGPICHVCAITKPHTTCDRRDISDEVTDRKKRLMEHAEKLKLKGHEIRKNDAIIQQRVRNVDKHLHGLHKIVATTTELEKKKVKEEKDRVANEINKEADEEIAKITKERDEKLTRNSESSTRKLEEIESAESKVCGDLKHVKDRFQETCDSMNVQQRKTSENMDETLAKVEKLVIEEKGLLKQFQSVMESFENYLKSNLNVERISTVASAVENIFFRRTNGRAIGLVGVPLDVWEQDDEFDMEVGKHPYMIGADENDGVFIRGRGGSIFVKNLISKATEKVIEGKEPYDIWQCTTLSDERIVCGTSNAEIVLYDQTWKHIATVSLDRGEGSYVYVSIDRNNMILAALFDARMIYVYDPSDMALVRSITIQHGPIYRINSLSSGDIAVVTRCSEGHDVCILDENGLSKCTSHFHDKIPENITVDQCSGSIHVMYYGHKECAVDVMSPIGDVTLEKALATTRMSLHSVNSCFLSHSGKLVISIDETIIVYKQPVQRVGELKL